MNAMKTKRGAGTIRGTRAAVAFGTVLLAAGAMIPSASADVAVPAAAGSSSSSVVLASSSLEDAVSDQKGASTNGRPLWCVLFPNSRGC
jgi:hypothetical protein